MQIHPEIKNLFKRDVLQMKILFYTANGVGLGHLRRTQLIAQELKKEVILVTSSLSPQKLGKFFNHLVKLEPFTDELDRDESKYLKARLKNKEKLSEAVKRFKPDAIVLDFYLGDHKFVFYPLEYALADFPGKKIFVWRLSFNKPLLELRKNAYRLSYFDKIIIPHAKDEISFFSPSFLEEIEGNNRFEICGPIFKKMDEKFLPALKKKYRILPKDFLITLTLGAGGGDLKGCQSPDKIIRTFFKIYPELIRKIPNLKVILSTGPYFKKELKSPGIKITQFEENLTELFSLSNLVISTAGYNSCNELVQAKVPLVLIPLKRGNDEQFKRAQYLKSKGIARVIENISERNLLEAILDSKKMNSINLVSGNKEAAGVILKDD